MELYDLTVINYGSFNFEWLTWVRISDSLILFDVLTCKRVLSKYV